MKTSTFPLFAALVVAITLPMPADLFAQDRRPANVKRLDVADWGPKDAQVGDTITIRGSGITRRAIVSIDGRAVRPSSLSARHIKIRIPRGVEEGRITLRASGHDIFVGSLSRWDRPRLRFFSPSSGSPGTRVELRGSNFPRESQAWLGDRPMATQWRSAGSLIVTIPVGAQTDWIYVGTANSSRAPYPAKFRLLAQAPVLESFSPRRGGPNTLVRLHGQNFRDSTRVYYGAREVPVLRRGIQWIEVRIPRRARRGERFRIGGDQGYSFSSSAFELRMPPTLTGIHPTWGPPGTRIVIQGSGFEARDRVRLGDTFCPIVQLQDSRIVVSVPRGARSGHVELWRNEQSYASQRPFRVVYAPSIQRVTPLAGRPGTKILVAGSGLFDAEVTLGQVRIEPDWTRDGELQFTLPAQARSGTLRIDNQGGRASYAKDISVWNEPVITRVTPSRGGPGTRVALEGSDLSRAERFTVGGREMPIIRRSPGRVELRVPTGARSGPIVWTADGRRQESKWRFDITDRVEIQSVSPLRGGPGELLTLFGGPFPADSRVFMGQERLQLRRLENDRIEAVIPSAPGGPKHISISFRGGTAHFSQPFELSYGPRIQSVTPSVVKPGQKIGIYGANLYGAVVRLGNLDLPVIRQKRNGTMLWVRLPDEASGSGAVTVTVKDLQTTSRDRITIREGRGRKRRGH